MNPDTNTGRTATWNVSTDDERIILQTGQVTNDMSEETAREMAHLLERAADEIAIETGDVEGQKAIADGGEKQ